MALAARGAAKVQQRRAVRRGGAVRVRAAASAETESVKAAEAAGALNKLTMAITNSPINQGKLWLAKKQAGDFDEEAASKNLSTKVKKDDVVMFSFSTCPFCAKAKLELDAQDVPYTVYELNELGQEGKELRATLGAETGRTSVPSIWIAGECIGGCNDGPGLMPLVAAGELEAKLSKCSLPFKAKRALARLTA